jgi:hypothetical protein
MRMLGRTSVIRVSLGQESARQEGSLLGESGMSPLCEESCIILTPAIVRFEI